MRDVANPTRTPTFRLITIAACGLGSLVIALWALRNVFGSGLAALPSDAVAAVIAALCVLAASGAAISFFAGINEAADYVFRETQIDKLTGFHSRNATISRIAAASATAQHSGKPVFLIDIDIDRFKQINEAIGYAQGDRLIRTFAERLRAMRLDTLAIGRIGAGEFAILMPERARGPALEAVLDALVARMAEPFALATHQQSINISVGVATLPTDGGDPIALLRRSSLALQHARAGGAGGWALFQPEMGSVADRRQWIEAELHPAFERGDFDLHYQPQVSPADGRVVGYEALLRWNHPEHGPIDPKEFIPIAEETGMISPIGEWALRKACADARFLPEDCSVAVNISAVQFMSGDFVRLVRSVLDATRLDPARLELEVTESVMMQERERAAAILRELAEMGISVAVDDFGTGYSNLSYLIDFPFRKLKIDKSFVSRIDRDNGGAVVSTIVGLSRALGVHTIAEGVETEDQAQLLRAAGCDYFQGYLYGRPAPLVMRDGAIVALRQPALHH